MTKLVGNKKPPRAGRGRPKGSPNKTTALLKDAILKAAEQAGDEFKDEDGKAAKEGLIGYLKMQAVLQPGPFMALLGKVLPLQVTGDADNPIIINIKKYARD